MTFHRCSSVRWLLGALLAALTAGCVTTRREAPPSFLVVPAVWATPEPEAALALDDTVVESFGAVGGTVLRGEPIAVECSEDTACLAAVGRTRSVDKLVVLRAAQLGPTTLFRLQSIDVATAAMEQTAQTVIEKTEPDALSASAHKLADTMAALYRPPTPWYRRPAFIVVAGVVAVATTVVTVFAATSGGGEKPDIVVQPP